VTRRRACDARILSGTRAISVDRGPHRRPAEKTQWRSILTKSGLASRVKSPSFTCGCPTRLAMCSFLSLTQYMQLWRRNDGGVCRAFRRFGRGACPETPHRFLWRACPETPHRRRKPTYGGIGCHTAALLARSHTRSRAGKRKAGRLNCCPDARLLLFVAGRRPAVSLTPLCSSHSAI
jgi:hypothetical protein